MAASIRRVAVLAGGISHERDVSLRSGRRLADSLQEQGLEVLIRDPDATLLQWLQDEQPDVVWPALHGASGEDGALLDLLTLIGIPYVGSHPHAARLAWDKPTAKAVVRRAGIATPESITLPKETFRELGTGSVLAVIKEYLGTELAIKPAQGGSAQGVSLITTADALPRAMVDAFTYWDSALVEERIRGTEISVSILDTGDGPVALPAVEIVPLSGVYGFEARYNAGRTEFFAPARIDPLVAAKAATMAVGAHVALGLGYISRVDIMIDQHGVPWFLEANVLPGLTETSMLPLALEAAGHDLGWVYAALAQSAFSRGAMPSAVVE